VVITINSTRLRFWCARRQTSLNHLGSFIVHYEWMEWVNLAIVITNIINMIRFMAFNKHKHKTIGSDDSAHNRIYDQHCAEDGKHRPSTVNDLWKTDVSCNITQHDA